MFDENQHIENKKNKSDILKRKFEIFTGRSNKIFEEYITALLPINLFLAHMDVAEKSVPVIWR